MTDTHNLLAQWRSADADVHDAEVKRYEIEKEISANMEANRATFATIPGVEATFKTGTDYIKGLDGPLRLLAEELSRDELEALLTTQRPAPIRSFNMVAVKKLARRGGVFREALDLATSTSPAVLKVRSIES